MSTIAEVAREAGVSVATVSRVINETGTVSRETELRVKMAVSRLQYQPNVWGRSLRRRESRMLLIFVPNVSNPYYSSIISGIEDVARMAGYNTMLCITGAEKGRRMEYLSLLHNGRADGAVVLDTSWESVTIPTMARKFPMVQCCEYCLDESVSHVSIDNRKAAEEGVQYLLDLGHTSIGFIGSTNSFISTRQRREGYTRVLADRGLTGRVALADDDYSFLSGVAAARTLLTGPNPPTAIFCVSDVLALGAVRAGEELGLKVPEDLTVLGFDDVVYAAMFHPMLTTVSQPCYKLGRAAGEILLGHIAGEKTPQHSFLPHQLMLRDSTAALAVES